MNSTRRYSAVSLALCFLFATAALAGAPDDNFTESDNPIDRAEEACIKAGTDGTASLITCLAKADKAWRRELDRVYRQLHARITPPERVALEKSQAAWIKFRDAQSAFAHEYWTRFQGTMYPVCLVGGLVEVTRRRTLDLEAMLSTLEARTPPLN